MIPDYLGDSSLVSPAEMTDDLDSDQLAEMTAYMSAEFGLETETTAARQIRCKEKRDEKSSSMNEIAAVVK